MVTKIRKWGNSYALRIPKKILDQLAMDESKEVEIEVIDGKIVIKPVHSLDALLDRITEENRHGEIDFGLPQGKEVW